MVCSHIALALFLNLPQCQSQVEMKQMDLRLKMNFQSNYWLLFLYHFLIFRLYNSESKRLIWAWQNLRKMEQITSE